MAVQHGKDGAVKISTTALASVSSWKATVGADIAEVTSLGDAWTVRLAGVKDVSGTISCYIDPADASGQEVIRAAAVGGTVQANLRLYLSTSKYFEGSAFLTLSYNVAQGSTSTVDFNFSSTGAWTYN